MGYDMRFADGTAGDEGYFRLNIWGMGRYCEYMTERGMVFEAGQHPAWPEGNNDLLDRLKYPEFYPDEPPLTADEMQRAKEYRAANDAVLAWHGPEVPGIPMHKFSTNDGWLVLPAECEAAWRIGKDKPAPEGDEEKQEYWGKWLDYLHRAASHGGFEVH